MSDDYFAPGMAAALAAILFPVYWLVEISLMFESGELRVGIGALDILYFLVGGLATYVLYGLKQLLNRRCAYVGADILLIAMMAFSIISYLGIWLLGFFGVSEFVFGAAFVGSIVAFGALDVLLGIWLLRAGSDIPAGVRTFAAINIFLGFTELTFIFSIAVVVVYPICALVLCVAFLRKPEELQIV